MAKEPTNWMQYSGIGIQMLIIIIIFWWLGVKGRKSF